jgi:hypothetical protein
MYEGVPKSVRTGRPERGLQMIQLSTSECSYIAILCVSLVSFAATTLCVASQRVSAVVVVVYFVTDSVTKLLDTPLYTSGENRIQNICPYLVNFLSIIRLFKANEV